MDKELKEFLSSPEIVWAGIGLGVVLVLAVVLSLYQQARAKREADEQALQLKATPTEQTPFWIGIGISTGRGPSRNPCFFRIYSGMQELLFLRVSSYYVFIDPASVRAAPQRRWLQSTWEKGAALVLMGVAVLALIFRNRIAQGLPGNGHFLAVILMASALLSVILLFSMPRMRETIARRCRELDAMSFSKLRDAAIQESESFVASP